MICYKSLCASVHIKFVACQLQMRLLIYVKRAVPCRWAEALIAMTKVFYAKMKNVITGASRTRACARRQLLKMDGAGDRWARQKALEQVRDALSAKIKSSRLRTIYRLNLIAKLQSLQRT
jgi:hypothetical protein